MHKTNSHILTREVTNLPKAPAVYAIFSKRHCRYVGFTENLQVAITGHFMPGEPNVPLRYFMQSHRSKILLYEVLKYESTLSCAIIKAEWTALFDPADYEPAIAVKLRENVTKGDSVTT